MTKPTIVVLGAGQAGLQVAASLREARHEGRLVLVGDEPHPPYQRPPLSKGYLLGDTTSEQLTLRPAPFFSQHSIELMTGMRAVSIDRPGGRVCFEDGSVLPYDHLVLATGARNRRLQVPGVDLENVFYLRSLTEANALKLQLTAGKKAVVVGAGFIGLEFAASAAKHGLDVTVLEVTDRPMARAVSKTMSALIAREHEKMGVKLCFETQVRRLLGTQGGVNTVETVDGRLLPADFVLIGIGVLPNVELAQRCELPVEDGIVVDELLRTSDPKISAIGDVAAHVNAYSNGRRVRLESVQNAIDQARCVAARILGRPAAYQAVPWFWSNQGSLALQLAGLRSPHGEEVVRGDLSGTACSVFSFHEGKLVYVESLNRPADHVVSRRLLGARIALTPQQATDPKFELKSLLASRERAAG
jgi:3-phenylpropionate/trans-cinnamate dioxygenase ferredoxin reductase component